MFTAAADDDKYWDKEVRSPTLRFLAARPVLGSHGMPKNAEGNAKADTLQYVHSVGGGASKQGKRSQPQKRKRSTGGN